MNHALVDSVDKAAENIARYQGRSREGTRTRRADEAGAGVVRDQVGRRNVDVRTVEVHRVREQHGGSLIFADRGQGWTPERGSSPGMVRCRAPRYAARS